MDWASFWSACASITAFALLIVTGIYAWLTHRMAKAAERQLWEASRPRLIVSLQTNQSGQFFVLHIENIGQTPAEELTLRLDRLVCKTNGIRQPINEAPAFKNIIRSLPPRVPIRFGLGVYFSYFSEDADRSLHPLNFTVSACYNSGNSSFNETFPIDIWEQEAMTILERDYISDFAKRFPDQFRQSMENIGSTLEKESIIPQRMQIKPRSWAPWFNTRKSEMDLFK